jgi:hypothetical protein
MNPEEMLAITDQLLSDGVQRFFRFRICPNFIDALVPNMNVLFAFRSALHEHRVSELSLGFCGVMTSASRTIKDGSIKLPTAESVDTFRHSLNHVRQPNARRLEEQFGEIAVLIAFNTAIILFSLITDGL